MLGRDPRHRRNGGLDLFLADGRLAAGRRQQVLRRGRLVDHIDGLVGQLAVIDIARRQIHGRLQGGIGEADLVMFLIAAFQAGKNLDGVGHSRLVHIDLLEAADKRAVLFKITAIFLVGGRPHAAKRAFLQGGLQQVRGIHRPAGGCTGTDYGMDLINEEYGVVVLLDRLDDTLEPFFKIATIAGTCEELAHIKGVDDRTGKNVRHFAIMDAKGEALGNRCLANARITDIERVVLGPAAQHLNGAVDLAVAADQRVDAAGGGLRHQIDGIEAERVLPFGLGSFGFGIFLRAAPDIAFGTVTDIGHRVEAGHVHRLQEPDGMALALGENGHQHIGAGRHLASRRLGVDNGALDHPLEAGGRLHVHTAGRADDRREFVLDIVADAGTKFIDINLA